MGVDFLICTLCSDTFPDCGDFMRCEECESYLCPDCMQGYEYDDEYCIINCPVCIGEYDENRVLVYQGKHLWIIWARTPEEVLAAYAKIFYFIKCNTNYYTSMSKAEQVLYDKACKNRGDAIKDFLESRVGYEYESFYFENVETP